MSVAKLDVAKPIEGAELNFGPPFAIPLEGGARITYCPTVVLGGASDPSHPEEGAFYVDLRPGLPVKFKEGATIAYNPTEVAAYESHVINPRDLDICLLPPLAVPLGHQGLTSHPAIILRDKLYGVDPGASCRGLT